MKVLVNQKYMIILNFNMDNGLFMIQNSIKILYFFGYYQYLYSSYIILCHINGALFASSKLFFRGEKMFKNNIYAGRCTCISVMCVKPMSEMPLRVSSETRSCNDANDVSDMILALRPVDVPGSTDSPTPATLNIKVR